MNYGASKIDKLITIGTPYLGTPKALYAFATGDFLNSLGHLDYSDFIPLGVDDIAIKSLIKNMPGVYELLPTERYFKNGNYYVENKSNWPGYPKGGLNFSATQDYIRSWYNRGIYDKAMSTFQKGYSKKSLNAVYDDIIAKRIDAYVIVGYIVKTLSCLQIGYNFNLTTLDINKWGDGTVPIISSTFDFADMTRKPYYVNGIILLPD